QHHQFVCECAAAGAVLYAGAARDRAVALRDRLPRAALPDVPAGAAVPHAGDGGGSQLPCDTSATRDPAASRGSGPGVAGGRARQPDGRSVVQRADAAAAAVCAGAGKQRVRGAGDHGAGPGHEQAGGGGDCRVSAGDADHVSGMLQPAVARLTRIRGGPGLAVRLGRPGHAAGRRLGVGQARGAGAPQEPAGRGRADRAGTEQDRDHARVVCAVQEVPAAADRKVHDARAQRVPG
ncbi:hypothetical protein EC988_009694, partial [Linderina pennispora]